MVNLGYTYLCWQEAGSSADLIKDKGNATRYQFDILGVNEARELKRIISLVSRKSSSWLLIGTKQITIEAQNALLKSIEDQDENLGIIFELPKSTDLLPTFLSRVQIIESRLTDSVSRSVLSEAQSFTTMTVAERLAYIEAENYSPGILDGLEKWSHVEKNVLDKKILGLKKLLRDGAINTKMALEHITYMIPKT